MSLINALFYLLYHGLILLIVTVFLLYIYFQFEYQYWKRRGVPVLEPKFPFGNLSRILDGNTHVSDMMKQIYDSAKDSFVGVYFLHYPALLIKDPKMLRTVLVKDFNYFPDRGIHSNPDKDPLSLHLLRLSGPRWRVLRAKLTPTFTSGKLKMMFACVTKSVEQLQESLERTAEAGAIVDVRDLCSRYTTDVISSCAFGIETNSFSDKEHDIQRFMQGLTRSTDTYFSGIKRTLSMCAPEVLQLFGAGLHSQALTKFLFGLLRSVIDHRRLNKIVRKDFLQLLIQLMNTGKVNLDDSAGDASVYEQEKSIDAISFEEMAAQAFVFIIAGYETSAATMSNCLYELAKNPQLQSRVQANIDETLAKHDGKFTYESIKDMEYLSMAVSETLRKYPPLGFLNRVAVEDYHIPESNITIEKNTKIVISVTGLHYDPRYFPDPEKFDPDRFSAENKDKIIPFTYLPFGDGPRNCIGMRLGKMQTIAGLAMILSKYDVSVCSETPKKFTLKVGPLISTPKETMKLFIKKRK